MHKYTCDVVVVPVVAVVVVVVVVSVVCFVVAGMARRRCTLSGAYI